MARLRSWAAAAAVLLLSAVTQSAWADEPLHLRIGWAVVPGQLTAIIFAKSDIPVFQKDGVFKHYGKSYAADLYHFRGSTPQITGLGTGDLDIASLAFSSFGLAIQNAHMQDLRVVSDLYQDGAQGHYSSEYMVRADSNIHKVEDLKGKVLASNGFGGAVDMALRKMMRDHGFEVNRDYQLVEVEFPNMMAAIEEKKIDLGGLVTPFSMIARKTGHFRTLFTVKDAMGPTQLTLFAMRAPFIAAHRPALVDFFEDFERATQWLLNPKNRKEAIAMVVRVTKKPAADYSDWIFTKDDYYHDPYARPNLQALQNNLNLQKDLGFLKINIDVKKYADLSLVDDAAKRLKH